MSELTFEDLRVRFGTGRAYTISGKGRDRVMGYRVGMQCNLGDIEVSEWLAMVKELIVQTGEQELFEQLHTHMKEHNYPLFLFSFHHGERLPAIQAPFPAFWPGAH